MPVRPNAIIIGAGKAGSTSLYNYLGTHPEIVRSQPKEVMYFTTHYDKGPEWYLSHFPGANDAPVALESTPQYSFRDEFPEVAARIRDYNPEMKLLYIVREPIARIVSHFNHWARIYPGRYADIEQSLSVPTHRKFFVERSRYFYQLGAYRELFPDTQIKVVILEELKTDFVPALNEVFAFLGVGEIAERIDNRVWNSRPGVAQGRVWSAVDISEARQAEIRGYLREDMQRLFAFCGKNPALWGGAFLESQ